MATATSTPELKLRNVILSKHRSIRAFCNMYNLPYSTIDNVFKRGVNSVSISTATQLCDALELDLSAFGKGIIAAQRVDEPVEIETKETELLENFRRLDTHGKELVGLVASKERERCESGEVVQTPLDGRSWQQYLGTPIACRGGGVRAATEEDARQMELIYRGLLEGNHQKGGVNNE